MRYTRHKIEGGLGALREFDDVNFLKPNGQSRNINVYGLRSGTTSIKSANDCFRAATTATVITIAYTYLTNANNCTINVCSKH